jgi:hypothetical protein
MLARRGSSFRELHVPFRVLRLPTCPRTRPEPVLRPSRTAPEAPSMGFCALFATSASGIHTRPGFPPRTSVRPRRFARPRRFSPPPALRVCFTPLPRPGFSLQGVLPRPEHEPVSRPAVPSCRCASRCRGSCPPCAAPSAAGRCSPGGCGGFRRRLGRRDSAPLLGLRLLRVFPPAHRDPNPGFSAGPETSACDLRCDEPAAADPWRLAGARVGWRGTTLPPRSRFSA